MEPIENIALVCDTCYSESYKKYIEFQPAYFLNKHVKLKFASANEVEHCWVFVKEIQDETLIGMLANDPIFDIGLSFGDEIKFLKSEIEDVYG